MRVQERPRWKAGAGVLFDTFAAGAEAVRALGQSGLWPSNCRLLDEAEGALTMAAPDGKALLVLGFESADHPVETWLERALELAGGQARGETRSCRRPTCATHSSRAA
jgi:alkyldihydroxyacetonephosphate synthase